MKAAAAGILAVALAVSAASAEPSTPLRLGGDLTTEEPVALHQAIATPKKIAWVSIHLIDSSGLDRGALGEVFVTINNEGH